ncbi:MAG: YiiX/YebB-like N1pC/P60 family cysteine hydrolase [Desulfobacterales bacterium]
MSAPPKLTQGLERRVLRHLERPNRRYRRYAFNNMTRLFETIQPGDVLLVEGNSEISRWIKLFSNSQWSHVAYYVGDALISPEHPVAKATRQRHAEGASRLLVEAFTGRGVITTPLEAYRDYNIRICRPYGIQPEDQRRVTRRVVADIGKHYDTRNILDIALMTLPLALNPFRRRSIKACLGGCSDYQVICSGMIAKAFQSVDYPIVPAFDAPPGSLPDFKRGPYGARLIMRHYSQILPRDFDLSPNFEVIKFNLPKDEPFDYQSLWADG